MIVEDQFPKLSRDSYTTDGKPIYGGSIGMNKIYDDLVETADKPVKSPFRLVVINALTLIRNNYDKKYRICSDNCRADINTLLTYLSIYLRKKQERYGKDRRVTILLVWPDYSKLPDTIRKPYTAEMKRLVEVYQTELKSVSKKLSRIYEDDVLSLFTVRLGSKVIYPHRDMIYLLRDQIAKNSRNEHDFDYKHGDPIHLLSHVCLDWHLANVANNVSLLESYTGEIVSKEYLGGKLLGKKDSKIPFDSIIHQTFGDKTLVKPLAVRKTKTELIDSADAWSMMSRAKIAKQIADVLKIPVYSLDKYKF